MRMQVIVEVEHMTARDAGMRMGRADRAAHACQGENPKQNQHDSDGEFHRHAEFWRNDDPEHDDRRTDRQDRNGVSDAPGGADQRRARHAVLATDDRRNSDHVVGVGCMPHPEEEAEKQKRQDIQGDFGHCARTKMAIPRPLLCSVSTQRQFQYARAPVALLWELRRSAASASAQ
jgi:hypothetical protein